jgi:tripartite-type tricarboxylate transporter receptor subunit TctC
MRFNHRLGHLRFCYGFNGLCFALLCLSVASVAAQTLLSQANSNYPNKPIRLIVPFTPGGSTDILARAVGTELTKTFGQSVIIDNVPGAGGSIGAERAARAPADGYTLLMGHIGTLAVNPALYPKLPYDPVKDFAPVAWVARVPNILVVTPSVAANDFKSFIALAKSKPGQLNYGSGGNGSAAHTTTEYLKYQAKISLLHIPYRGTAPSVTDLLAGQIQVMFTGAPTLLPSIKAGKLRPLAVSSPKRLDILPDVPTVAESGIAGTAGFEADQWYGVVAPRGTPADIVAKLNTAINAALTLPEVKTRLSGEGAYPTPSTPAVFGKLIESEVKRWGPVVKNAGIKAD